MSGPERLLKRILIDNKIESFSNRKKRKKKKEKNRIMSDAE